MGSFRFFDLFFVLQIFVFGLEMHIWLRKNWVRFFLHIKNQNAKIKIEDGPMGRAE